VRLEEETKKMKAMKDDKSVMESRIEALEDEIRKTKLKLKEEKDNTSTNTAEAGRLEEEMKRWKVSELLDISVQIYCRFYCSIVDLRSGVCADLQYCNRIDNRSAS
jgi:hypothetical protein